jgi:hypothetical protein
MQDSRNNGSLTGQLFGDSHGVCGTTKALVCEMPNLEHPVIAIFTPEQQFPRLGHNSYSIETFRVFRNVHTSVSVVCLEFTGHFTIL